MLLVGHAITLSIESQDSLNGNVDSGKLILLKHDLREEGGVGVWSVREDG